MNGNDENWQGCSCWKLNSTPKQIQECEDSSGDKKRMEDIDKCIQWLVSLQGEDRES